MEEILEKKKSLKYHMFDWDDNILVMPTMIHLERKVNGQWVDMDITTSEFVEVRKQLDEYYNKNNKDSEWRFCNDDKTYAFSEFRDYGMRGSGALLQDVKKSIEFGKFGPVWGEFINCLIGGHGFLIVTARGHEPETIKRTVRWVVYNILDESQRTQMVGNLKHWTNIFKIDTTRWSDKKHIDYYLDFCSFVGTDSKWFSDKFGTEGSSVSPEKYKGMAIKDYVQKVSKFGEVLKTDIKIGFSDDDLSTVESIYEYFKNELSLKFPMEYNIWHTKSDGTKTKMD